MPQLATELAYFDRHRAEWVQQGHEGEWVVVRGNELLGFFPTLEEAYKAGVKKFGPGDILVKEVTVQERVEKIQRAHWRASGQQQAS